MTRDEALKKMQAVKSYMTSGNPIWSVTEIGEAFDMAIEALEQPERNTGKWIGADSQCGIKCPFCGTPVDDFCNSIDYIDLIYEPNFCPNCGAMMEGEQP